jgi:hypothetical protein
MHSSKTRGPMSVMGQKRTLRGAAKERLFDYLVGHRKQRLRKFIPNGTRFEQNIIDCRLLMVGDF